LSVPESLLMSPRRWLPTLVRRAFDAWVHVKVFPQPLAIAADVPTCYVLARPSLTDRAMLDSLTRRGSVPLSHAPMAGVESTERNAYFNLRETRLSSVPPRLQRLLAAVSGGTVNDVQLVPVSIFWGRTPEREAVDGTRMRWLRMWAAEGWGGRSRLRKFLAIVFFRRDVVAKFGEPLSLKSMIAQGAIDGLSKEVLQRRIARVLRTRFRSEREAAIGPDLSHRRILTDAILQEPRVKQAIAEEVTAKKTTEEKVIQRAEKMAHEIAADYSYPIIRVFARALQSLWNRIYDGVDVRGADRLHALAKDHTIVYVPCHRSHIDYLLLSYVVREAGLTIPHIAAGANLNLPVVGTILRGGGAFFLRRSFKDDALYAEVFSAYVHEVLKRGFPVEYFVEGGRSRTGRMLQPKAGLISMTVQSYLREHTRPLAFVPVYIGYEKLMEGGSYTQELAGKAKRKESLWGLLTALKDMRNERYGRVGVSFARPILLGEMLDASGVTDFQAWLDDKTLRKRTLTELSRQIAERINGAAHINPVALVASVLLATPKHAADAAQMAGVLDRLQRLIVHTQIAPEIVMTPLSGKAAIEYATAIGYLERREHVLGDVVLAKEAEAVSLTYFRNNVLHCVALPGLIACLIVQHGTIGRAKLSRMARELYVLMETELYLPEWVNESFAPFDATLAAMIDDGWVAAEDEASVISVLAQGTDAALQLETLASTIRPTLTRHALMLALVVREASGSKSRESIEQLCQQAAQHLAMTHVFNAPEFSDKTQFKSAFDALLRADLVKLDSADFVHYDASLSAWASDAAFLLPPDTRAAVLRAARSHPSQPPPQSVPDGSA
jgi:glycerol-3-phosphate O-acyltransferase